MRVAAWLNRNSFIVLSIALLLILGWWLRGSPAILILAIFVVGVAFVALNRARAAPDMPVAAKTPAGAAAGKYALVEFYSDY